MAGKPVGLENDLMRCVARMVRAGVASFETFEWGRAARWLFSRIFLVIGCLFVLLGLAEMLTPLPFGIPLILLGVTIALNSSTTAKKRFVIWGQRYPRTVGRVRSWIRDRRRASHKRKQS